MSLFIIANGSGLAFYCIFTQILIHGKYNVLQTNQFLYVYNFKSNIMSIPWIFHAAEIL